MTATLPAAAMTVAYQDARAIATYLGYPSLDDRVVNAAVAGLLRTAVVSEEWGCRYTWQGVSYEWTDSGLTEAEVDRVAVSQRADGPVIVKLRRVIVSFTEEM